MASNFKTIDALFASIAHRIQPFVGKDPQYTQIFVEKAHEFMKDNKDLQTIYKASKILTKITLNFINLLAQLDKKEFIGQAPKEIVDLVHKAKRIKLLLSDSTKIVYKALKNKKILTLDIIDTNDAIIELLACEEVVKYAPLKDTKPNDLRKIAAKYKETAKKFAAEAKDLQKFLRALEKQLKAKLKEATKLTKTHQQEAFYMSEIVDNIKQFLSKLLRKLLSFTYKLYKQAALVAKAIDNYITTLYTKAQDKIIQKLAGDDIRTQMALSLGFVAVGVFGASKFNSIIVKALPLLGPFAGVFIALKGLSFIANLESSSVEGLRSLISGLQAMNDFIDNIDKELDALGV